MKAKYLHVKMTLLFSILFLMSLTYASAAEPYKKGSNERLDALFTQLQPSVELFNGKAENNKVQPPIVISMDAGTSGLLASQSQAFESAELIVLRLKAPRDENIKLTAQLLGQFVNLHYVIVLYEYNACNSGNNCLDTKTIALVNLPANSGIKVYYELSIPQ